MKDLEATFAKTESELKEKIKTGEEEIKMSKTENEKLEKEKVENERKLDSSLK